MKHARRPPGKQLKNSLKHKSFLLPAEWPAPLFQKSGASLRRETRHQRLQFMRNAFDKRLIEPLAKRLSQPRVDRLGFRS
jgi:hypothetical protein